MSKIPKQACDPVSIKGRTYVKRSDILQALGAHEGSELYAPTSISQYLWYYEDDDVNMIPPTNYSDSIVGGGACSSVVAREGWTHNYVIGRSFDWFLNNDVEFVCRLHANGHHILGTSSAIKGASYDNVCTGKLDPELIPYHLVDGINESGLYVAILVVSSDLNPSGDHVGNGPKHITTSEVPFYLLSHASTLQEACNCLEDLTVDIPESIQAMGYECHYHIGDPSTGYIVLEMKDGTWEWSFENIVTNFQLWPVEVPPIKDLPELGSGFDFINYGFAPHAAGIERFKLIQNATNYDTVDGMKSLLDQLKYSRTYDAANHWYSECTVGEVNVNSSLAQFLHVQSVMVGYWGQRQGESGDGFCIRDNVTSNNLWFSNHQCIFDVPNRKMLIRPQEAPAWLEYQL